MEQNPNKNQDIQQLIHKLKTGILSAEERAELDNYALEDPFLKEALDGYSEFSETEHQPITQRLREKVLSQSEQREIKRTPVYLRVAAAAVLLVCAGWFMREVILLNKNDNIIASVVIEKDDKSEISTPDKNQRADINEQYVVSEESGEILENAQGLEPVLETYSYSSNSAKVEIAETSSPGGEILDQEKIDTNYHVESYSADNNPPRGDISAVEILFKEEEEMQSPPPKGDLVVSAKSDSAYQVLEKNKADSLQSFANAMPQSNLHRTIQGIVIDEKGNPLVGVNIFETGTQNGVVTDIVGRFSIMLENLNNALNVSYTGYQESEIASSQRGKYIEVMLLENQVAMDEIAFERLSKRTQKDAPSSEFILAKPLDGFINFEKYIELNARYPSGYNPDLVNGTVQVTFILDKQGNPQTIKVTSSFNQEFNKEAIRLIRAGGTWLTKPKGQTGQVVFNIEF